MSDPWEGKPRDEWEDPYPNVFKRTYRALFERSRRRRITSIAVIGVAAAGLFGWKGAPWFIQRADKSDTSCNNSNYAREPGASLSCEGRARHWLWPAKIVPWTYRAAHDRELRIRTHEGETRVTLATEVFLDPAMRDEGLKTLLDTVSVPEFPAELRRGDWVFAIAAGAGSRQKVIELASQAKGGFDRERAFRAALGLGDVATALPLARVEDDDVYAYEYDMRRGALLCLAGDAPSGLLALKSAMLRYEAQVHFSYPEAQVAMLACGAPAGSQTNSTYAERIFLADLLADPSTALRHIDPQATFEQEARTSKEPFVAAAIAGGAITAPEDVVAYAGTMTVNAGGALTQWVPFGPIKEKVAFDPENFEKAADKLDALADDIDHGKVKVVGKHADEPGYDYLADPWRYKRREVNHFLKEPGKTLRAASLVLRVEAIAIYASLLQAEPTKRMAARIGEVQGPTALLVGASLDRIGEKKLARAMYEAATNGKDAGARVYGWLSIAMLDLGEGRGREAVDAVAKASQELGPVKAEIDKADLGWAFDITRSVGWVAAAAALMTGDASVPVKVGTPTYYESEPDDMKSVPADWFALARADDKTRRLARFRMFDPSSYLADQAVLPAMIYVLREVARDGKDPEMWLEKALPIHDPSLNGATAMRARAEAARWRKAGDEAARWDERAARLEKLLSASPKAATLAFLVGLE
jgi:hypothetical protein